MNIKRKFLIFTIIFLGMDHVTADKIGITIRAGASVAGGNAAFKGFTYSVCFKLELENYTSFELIAYTNYVDKGQVPNLPTNVKPGEMELMAGHKSGWTPTGVEGIATWSIGDTGKLISVMYSLPYNFNHHMNKLAVGIHNKIDVSTKDLFQKMEGGTEEHFERKAFYYDTKSLTYSDDENRFTVVGIMGKEHRCTIKISLTASKIEERAVFGEY